MAKPSQYVVLSLLYNAPNYDLCKQECTILFYDIMIVQLLFIKK